MAHNYYKSPEGVAEYGKVGLKYEYEMWDKDYDKFLEITKKTPAKEANSPKHC